MTQHVDIRPQTITLDPRPVVTSTAGTLREPRRMLVLLLEDEPLIAMDVEMTLEAAGFEVVNVMSCEEANAWLDRHVPDVVVVEIGLRDGPCTEVASRLVLANVPFVVHSGDHPIKYAGTPFAEGAWVTKPSTADELTRAVRALHGLDLISVVK